MMTPAQNPSARPLPIGELLERLRAEGFAVAPTQYGRVFTVVGAVFPNGISPATGAEQIKTLRELLGPIVCRTFAEQERFGHVFDLVMAGSVPEPVDPKPVERETTKPELKKNRVFQPKDRFWPFQALLVGALAVVIFVLLRNKPEPDGSPVNCYVDFGIQSVQGKTVTFVNRSPGVANGQVYEWDFGDGTPPFSTSLPTVQHQFDMGADQTVTSPVTLKGVDCSNMSVTQTIPDSFPIPKSTYNPTLLPFLRLPETSRYTLANWVPLLLLGLGGLLGGGWWVARRRRQQRLAAQRPAGGPFFLSFPQQNDAIQPSPSLVSWAQQLQQREESERHTLAINPTIRRTIRNGGMPSVQYEAIKRRPRYLILIDDRSAYDQQAKLYAYVMGVLITRSVEMDVFFFHSDPRYCWNENYPTGLSIADLYRLYGAHYLVLVTEGARLFDYDTGEVANWATEVLSGWASRALLTPVYPANWHYLEAALSRFFILLPATPDGQFLLRDYLGQPDNAPSFADLLLQFKVLPGTPNRGIFSLSSAQLTVDDVRSFVNQAAYGSDQADLAREWLFTWACATAVFPTPDWAMTLAIGHALETSFTVDGLVTSTNILKLTALPWLRQDSIPEPLRGNLLAQLPPDVEAVARKTVMTMLNELQLSSGSVAYEEQQLRLWEQEYHLQNKQLGKLANYGQYPDLVKDEDIRQRLTRHSKLRNTYQPAGLLLLGLLPLLLYLTPPQTQVAEVLIPFFRNDSTATDSAVFYNNRAVASFRMATTTNIEQYGNGILDLFHSVDYRLTFEAVYNMNTARYNLGVFEYNAPAVDREESDQIVRQRLSPYSEIPQLMAPFRQFDNRWVPDSVTTRHYLRLLVDRADNNTIYAFVNQANQASVNKGTNRGIEVGSPVDRQAFNRLVDKAKTLFQSPGTREFEQDSLPARNATLGRILVNFKPTTPQRDSLISLEAARIVLYFGGPQRSGRIRVEAIESQATISALPPPATDTQALQRQTIDRQLSARPRIKPSVKTPKSTKVRVPTVRIPATAAIPDSVAKNPNQPPTKAAPDELIQTKTTPPTNQTVGRSDPPATLGNDDAQSNQQTRQVQQQTQQQPPVDESTLQLVYEQGTKCTTDNSFSIALPKGDKRPIQSGILTLLSNSPNLYELTFYCDSYPQTIYSKRGFSHVKVEKDAKSGGIRVLFYRNGQRAK